MTARLVTARLVTARHVTGRADIKNSSHPRDKWASMVATPLFVVLLPFIICPLANDVTELPKLVLLDIGLALALAIAAWRHPLPMPPLSVLAPLCALVALATMATLLSPAPLLSLLGTYEHYNGLLTLLRLALLVVLGTCLVGPIERHTLILAVGLTASLIAGYGALQHYGLDPAPWETGAGSATSALAYRSFATLSSPSFLGLYLCLTLPLSLSGLATARSSRSTLAWTLAVALITMCLVFTYSRAAWLGAVAGVVIWSLIAGWRTPKTPLVALLVLMVALLGAALSPVGGRPSIQARAASVLDPAVASSRIRIKLAQGTVQAVTARPVTGWGPDTFRDVFPRFAPPNLTDEQRRNASAHNIWLDAAYVGGIPMLLSLLWLMGAVIWAGLQKLKPARPQQRTQLAGFCAALTSFFLALQFGFSSIAPWALAAILVGALIGPQPGQSFGRTPTKLLAVGWVLVATTSIGWLIADMQLRRGLKTMAAAAGTGDWGGMGRDLASLNELRSACRWFPHHEFALITYGQQLLSARKDAVPVFLQARQFNPLNAGTRALLAQAYMTEGRMREATAEWHAATIADPQWLTAAAGYNQARSRVVPLRPDIKSPW